MVITKKKLENFAIFSGEEKAKSFGVISPKRSNNSVIITISKKRINDW